MNFACGPTDWLAFIFVFTSRFIRLALPIPQCREQFVLNSWKIGWICVGLKVEVNSLAE